MSWQVEFDAAAAKEFRKLHPSVQQRIQRFLRDRILAGDDPRRLGKALTGESVRLWRYRAA